LVVEVEGDDELLKAGEESSDEEAIEESRRARPSLWHLLAW
jgi:hypothetical protein